MKKYNDINWLPKDSILTTATINEVLNKKVVRLGKTTASFCFIFDKEEIILLEHANKKRGYDIPGGHLEELETPIEAMEREVLEEVGCLIENIQPVGYQIIQKVVADEKYPDLLSNQMFFKADLKELLNIDLEKDSNGIKKMLKKDFEEYLKKENKLEILDLLNLC